MGQPTTKPTPIQERGIPQRQEQSIIKVSNKQAVEPPRPVLNQQRNQEMAQSSQSTSQENVSSFAKFGTTNRKSVFSSSVLPKSTVDPSQFEVQKTTPLKTPTPTPPPHKPLPPKVPSPTLPPQKPSPPKVPSPTLPPQRPTPTKVPKPTPSSLKPIAKPADFPAPYPEHFEKAESLLFP